MANATKRDISDAILTHLSNFAVGLIRKKGREGSEVLGSGVLASIEGRKGILTCGHVAEQYENLPEVGLVRFVTGGNNQRHLVRLTDAFTIIGQNSDSFCEKKEVADLAFTYLHPDVAGSLEAHGIFLNVEKNRTKIESSAPSQGKHVDAALGLVAEFSGQPFVDGKEIISPMRGVLHTGHITAQENGLLTLDAMQYNLDQLPNSFGGMSGCGLWRVYFEETETASTILTTAFCGIASWQIDSTRLAFQGWDRIDQGLIPGIREKLRL